jgi:4Fe-4S ferredoxin
LVIVSGLPTSLPKAKASCKGPGILVPVVDPKRCEAKGDCIQVCPTGVFELRRPTEAERSALGFLGRLKLRVHGGQLATVASPSACEACGLCVPACPEDAITLRSVDVTNR